MRFALGMLLAVLGMGLFVERPASAELRAGAALVDVTPMQFPVFVNGGMTAATATKAVTPLYARAIVLDDGRERLALVVVDSCMMSRPFLDEAKQLAAQRTKIRPDRMMISATHTHTAAASMGCLGTDADPTYIPLLREKLAEAIAAAESHLEPAKVGWAVGNAGEYTALRQWVIRPDRMINDPFGNPTVRANMHAGANWDNVTGEAGPKDPDLSLIAFQSLDGRPIGLLANFSMHYFSGVEAINYDYFGRFCQGFQQRVESKHGRAKTPFVAIMSHGCSGDIWRRDYTKPPLPKEKEPTIDSYTEGLLGIAFTAYDRIEYRRDADLAMAEARRTLKYRVPDKQRLEWAQRVVAAMGDRLPKTTEEVYAREQLILHERQSTEIVIQAVRIGEIAIATTPNETYALTGLKLKLQSPLPKTMVIELANGGDGYIPPPEQHPLGGYNTWAARSAGLEEQAEPIIAEQALELLERVAGQPRRIYRASNGPAAAAIRQAKPAAYWRLDEWAGRRAVDASGNQCHAIIEPGVLFFLEGPRSATFCQGAEMNRAVHFAGGRLDAKLPALNNRYSVSLWFWNGMPNEGRTTSGWIVSRGPNQGQAAASEHLGIGGTATAPGKLIFQRGEESQANPLVVGRTVIERWTWSHLLLVRDGEMLRAYLNGADQPEIETKVPPSFPPEFDQWYFGGRSDNVANWEGRLDEIAVFDRVATAEERAALADKPGK